MNLPREQAPVVLLSGGSRGLGRALVADLLAHGYIVATFSRTSSPFIARCQQDDPQSKAFLWGAVDSTDDSAMQDYVRRVTQQYGRIDALINNSGVAMDGVLALARADDVQRMLAVNLEATIRLTRLVVRGMLRQSSSSSIVNISSIVGSRGYSGLAVYGATKAALDGFTRSLARELGPRHIRVNAVAPGFLATDMTAELDAAQQTQIVRRTPLGRLGTGDDVAGVVRFLLSPEARFMTGQILTVDGGLTC